MINQINPSQAIENVKNGSLFIDVREVEEVNELNYDINNYMNIPLSLLEFKLTEIPKDKDLILACRSGGRSQNACNILINNGYNNLSNLEGGIIGWQRSGNPIKK